MEWTLVFDVSIARGIIMRKCILAVMLAVSSVSASAKKIDPASLSYGYPPDHPDEAIRSYFETILKDPESAHYTIAAPYRGYCKQGWARGRGLDWIGWAMNVTVNARNSFGGYTGAQPYTVMFNGGMVVKHTEGHNFGAFGPSKGPLGLDGGAGVCSRYDPD